MENAVHITGPVSTLKHLLSRKKTLNSYVTRNAYVLPDACQNSNVRHFLDYPHLTRNCQNKLLL